MELKSGTRVVAKFRDGRYYRARVKNRFKSGRYSVDHDDGDRGSVEPKDVFVISSALTRCQEILEKVRRARDTIARQARSELRDGRLKLANERREIENEW